MSDTVLDRIEKWIGDGRYHPEAAAMLRAVVSQAREANRLRELVRKILGWIREAGYSDKFWPDRQAIIREAESACELSASSTRG